MNIRGFLEMLPDEMLERGADAYAWHHMAAYQGETRDGIYQGPGVQGCLLCHLSGNNYHRIKLQYGEPAVIAEFVYMEHSREHGMSAAGQVVNQLCRDILAERKIAAMEAVNERESQAALA